MIATTAGELTGRTFTRTAGLVLRFKSYGALVAERWPARLDQGNGKANGGGEGRRVARIGFYQL